MALGVNLDLAIEQVNRAKDDIEFIDVSHAPATFRPQWRVEDGEKKGGGGDACDAKHVHTRGALKLILNGSVCLCIQNAREKQLWLRIANHVITVDGDISRAMDLLKVRSSLVWWTTPQNKEQSTQYPTVLHFCVGMCVYVSVCTCVSVCLCLSFLGVFISLWLLLASLGAAFYCVCAAKRAED